MEQRRFPPRPRTKPEEGCKIEIRKTKFGKKLIVSKNCSREQLKMLQETGELNIKDSGENEA